jgi:DNA-binding response OmpR family regulator
MPGNEVEVSTVSGLQIDRANKQVWVDGIRCPQRLTGTEMKFLLFLAAHPGKVCSRKQTVPAVYGNGYVPKVDGDRLDAMVRRIRKKIEGKTRPPRFLVTVHGIGHRLDYYLGERL